MIKTKDVKIGSLVKVVNVYRLPAPDNMMLGLVTAYYGKTPGKYLYTYEVFFLSGEMAGCNRLIHIGMPDIGNVNAQAVFHQGCAGSGQFMIWEIVSNDA